MKFLHPWQVPERKCFSNRLAGLGTQAGLAMPMTPTWHCMQFAFPPPFHSCGHRACKPSSHHTVHVQHHIYGSLCDPFSAKPTSYKVMTSSGGPSRYHYLCNRMEEEPHMHDQCGCTDLGDELDVGEDVQPGGPPCQCWFHDPHACG